ncbi:hypothetical protein Tco_1256215 [Tanacetum coccineum]
MSTAVGRWCIMCREQDSKEDNDMYYPRFTKVIVGLLHDKDHCNYNEKKDHADQPKHVRVRSLQDYLCSATWWKKIQNPNMANIKLISESFSQKEDATTVKRQESTVCLSDVAETEAINEASHKKKFDRNASGSGADEGTGSKPGVPNVPTYGKVVFIMNQCFQ